MKIFYNKINIYVFYLKWSFNFFFSLNSSNWKLLPEPRCGGGSGERLLRTPPPPQQQQLWTRRQQQQLTRSWAQQQKEKGNNNNMDPAAELTQDNPGTWRHKLPFAFLFFFFQTKLHKKKFIIFYLYLAIMYKLK